MQSYKSAFYTFFLENQFFDFLYSTCLLCFGFWICYHLYRFSTMELPWLFVWFFSIRDFFHGHWRLTGEQEKGGTIFYSILPLPPAHEHSGICFRFCMWDHYHIFLIKPLVFTRLLLDEICYLMELPFDWLIMWC